METNPSPNHETTLCFQEIGEASTLEKAFEGVENEVKITKQPNSKNYGPFHFQLYATQSTMLQGKVNYNLSSVVKNVDGKPLINIDPYFAFLQNGRKFEVKHGTITFGLLTVNPLSNTYLITSGSGTYTAKKIGNDLLISKRDFTNRSITLASIHIPAPSFEYIIQPFECLVTFQALNTFVEKSLFISLAVAIMMVGNGPVLAKERDSACPMMHCLNVCVIVLLTVVVVFAIGIGFGYRFLPDMIHTKFYRP